MNEVFVNIFAAAVFMLAVLGVHALNKGFRWQDEECPHCGKKPMEKADE